MAHVLPFRLRVLHAITDALKTITPANGYAHDLSDYTDQGETMSRVFRGRDVFGFNDPRPMVSVLEHPRALDALLGPDGATDRVAPWELLIQGFVNDDPENPTDPAHLLVADVIKALALEAAKPHNILGLGFRMPAVAAGGMKIGSPVCRPADDEISSVAFFFLTIALDLVEDVADPFA